METALGIALGLGLSAACGFRVFVPLLVLGVASFTGTVTLGSGFEWLSSPPALIALGLATTLEIAAYYVPWLDNVLDTIASPAAVMAGAVAAVAVQSNIDPLLHWSVVAIAGGGAASLVQVSTVALRGASTALTGGLASVFLSTGEWFGALAVAIMAIVAPVVALLLVVFVALVAWVSVRRRRSRAGLSKSREVSPQSVP
jgi:hypothetical protein